MNPIPSVCSTERASPSSQGDNKKKKVSFSNQIQVFVIPSRGDVHYSFEQPQQPDSLLLKEEETKPDLETTTKKIKRLDSSIRKLEKAIEKYFNFLQEKKEKAREYQLSLEKEFEKLDTATTEKLNKLHQQNLQRDPENISVLKRAWNQEKDELYAQLEQQKKDLRETYQKQLNRACFEELLQKQLDLTKKTPEKARNQLNTCQNLQKKIHVRREEVNSFLTKNWDKKRVLFLNNLLLLLQEYQKIVTTIASQLTEFIQSPLYISISSTL